jgi:hypothetical protein
LSERGFLRTNRLRASPPVTQFDALTARELRGDFLSPEDAPFNKPVFVQVSDGFSEYALPFACVRTADGWLNKRLGTKLTVEVVGWRWSMRPRQSINVTVAGTAP